MDNKVIRMQIRIPVESRDWVRDEGKKHSRSINGEIVQILKAEQERREAA